MKKHKFKKGDKVRIIGNGNCIDTVKHHFNIGDIGEIVASAAYGFIISVEDLIQYVEREHVEIVKEDQK